MMSRGIKCGLVAFFILIIAPLVVPYFIPWTPLNCRTQYIDIVTGRVRNVRYLCFLKMSDHTSDSSVSTILKDDLDSKRKPEWRPVNTFSPGVRHSPHYRFHGVFSQLHTLDMLWDEGKFDLPTKQATARHILALWQFDESYHLASKYLDSLGEMVLDGKSSLVMQALEVLSVPQIQKEGNAVVITLPYPDGKPMERLQGYYGGNGEFVRHGVREMWTTSGQRQLYDHFVNDSLRGRRFEWDNEGKLSSISSFGPGLTEYESSNFERHPDFEYAKKLADNPLTTNP